MLSFLLSLAAPGSWESACCFPPIMLAGSHGVGASSSLLTGPLLFANVWHYINMPFNYIGGHPGSSIQFATIGFAIALFFLFRSTRR